jgi:prepilin-type N-terminal cleavage/methylation domain-containing protein
MEKHVSQGQSRQLRIAHGRNRRHQHCRQREEGFTLLEMMIAVMVLLVGSIGVLALFSFSVMQSTTQGDHATRTAEYAQDKMEQLMALSYNDLTSDVTKPITASGTCCGLSIGGSSNPASPTTGYVDYVTADGTPQPASAGAAYIRVWEIKPYTTTYTTTLKKIIVVSQQLAPVRGTLPPSTRLMSLKSSATDN